MSFTIEQIAKHIGAKIVAKEGCDPNVLVTGLNTLQDAAACELSFLSNPKYKHYLPVTKAAVVILPEIGVPFCPTHALVMENPYLGFAKAAALFDRTPKPDKHIHQSAVIDESATIGLNVTIGPFVRIGAGVVIEDEVTIGAGCVIDDHASLAKGTILKPNVSIYHEVIIGKNCIIHSGAVIGSDGFGMANENGRWVKIPQIGTVVLGDEVEIGANTTIDRGALGNTEIHDGVKIDNKVQIAHNVIIGAHTVIAANAGIAGSTTIGKYCMIGGAAGIVGHIKIVDKVMISAMSMVTRSIKTPGIYSSGLTAREHNLWHKNVARFNQLDKLAKRLIELEKTVNS